METLPPSPGCPAVVQNGIANAARRLAALETLDTPASILHTERLILERWRALAAAGGMAPQEEDSVFAFHELEDAA